MKANLCKTNSWLAKLSDCIFERANLENTILRGVICVSTRFTQVNLGDAEISETQNQRAVS